MRQTTSHQNDFWKYVAVRQTTSHQNDIWKHVAAIEWDWLSGTGLEDQCSKDADNVIVDKQYGADKTHQPRVDDPVFEWASSLVTVKRRNGAGSEGDGVENLLHLC